MDTILSNDPLRTAPVRTIPENLTIKQFGELYGPGVTKTYSLLKKGELKGIKIGRLTYIPREAAESWKRSLPAYNAAEV